MECIDYFVKNGNMIKKYCVSFDKDKLQSIQREIIDNCSDIVNCENSLPNEQIPFGIKNNYLIERREIRNFQTHEKTGERDDFYKVWTFFRCTWTEYRYPTVVNDIESLIQGDINGLTDLINSQNNEEQAKEEIDKISRELDEIDNFNIDKKKEKLTGLEYAIKQMQKQEKIDKYLEKIFSNINISYIDSISIDEMKKLEEFFNCPIFNELSDTIASENILTKIIEKNKKDAEKDMEKETEAVKEFTKTKLFQQIKNM